VKFFRWPLPNCTEAVFDRMKKGHEDINLVKKTKTKKTVE